MRTADISSSLSICSNGVIGTCPGYFTPITSIGPISPLRGKFDQSVCVTSHPLGFGQRREPGTGQSFSVSLMTGYTMSFTGVYFTPLNVGLCKFFGSMGRGCNISFFNFRFSGFTVKHFTSIYKSIFISCIDIIWIRIFAVNPKPIFRLYVKRLHAVTGGPVHGCPVPIWKEVPHGQKRIDMKAKCIHCCCSELGGLLILKVHGLILCLTDRHPMSPTKPQALA